MSVKKPRLNGNLVSRLSNSRSKTTKPSPTKKLEQLLAAVYNSLQKIGDPKSNARRRRNFVFHMTDWMEDLDRLSELYKNPDQFDQKAAAEVVAHFLLHAIPHLRAAGRLALDYNPDDIFQELDSTPE